MMRVRLWTMAAAALFLSGWASGEGRNKKMEEWLLPSGTLKAFAEYMPAYGKRAFPGPDAREAARLEQAVDAARKAKDARALAEAAARLDAYWQSKLDALYAPVAAWLSSRWFVKAELIPYKYGRAYEMPMQELQDELVMLAWAATQAAWEKFLQADEEFTGHGFWPNGSAGNIRTWGKLRSGRSWGTWKRRRCWCAEL